MVSARPRTVWAVRTNDVDFTGVGPRLGVSKGPVCGPDTTTVRHRVDVGDEEAALPGLLAANADGVALTSGSDVGGVVDSDDSGTVILDVRELGRGISTDIVDETVGGVGVGEEVPAAENKVSVITQVRADQGALGACLQRANSTSTDEHLPGSERNKDSLKETLALEAVYELVGGAPGDVGDAADLVVPAVVRGVVGDKGRGGCGKREDESSEGAEHREGGEG